MCIRDRNHLLQIINHFIYLNWIKNSYQLTSDGNRKLFALIMKYSCNDQNFNFPTINRISMPNNTSRSLLWPLYLYPFVLYAFLSNSHLIKFLPTFNFYLCLGNLKSLTLPTLIRNPATVSTSISLITSLCSLWGNLLSHPYQNLAIFFVFVILESKFHFIPCNYRTFL